jgi:hypothetical protein
MRESQKPDRERAEIDAQIEGLNHDLQKAMPDSRRQTEQALASAYVARELNGIRKFLDGLTILQEKA